MFCLLSGQELDENVNATLTYARGKIASKELSIKTKNRVQHVTDIEISQACRLEGK